MKIQEINEANQVTIINESFWRDLFGNPSASLTTPFGKLKIPQFMVDFYFYLDTITPFSFTAVGIPAIGGAGLVIKNTVGDVLRLIRNKRQSDNNALYNEIMTELRSMKRNAPDTKEKAQEKMEQMNALVGKFNLYVSEAMQSDDLSTSDKRKVMKDVRYLYDQLETTLMIDQYAGKA